MTARRRAEAALRQSQKIEAIGQLTGGVAHDFNNLLAVVLGNLELLRKRLRDDDRSKALLENAVEGAERGAALTQRMLAFARRQDLDPQAVDVSALVRGMADLLQRSIGPMVRIETHFPLRPSACARRRQSARAGASQPRVNARDAMPERRHDHHRRARGRLRPLRTPPVRDRHRRGHGRDHACPCDRAVLHHQGHRQGHRPRSFDGARARRAVGRWVCPEEPQGRRHDGRDLAAARNGAGSR